MRSKTNVYAVGVQERLGVGADAVLEVPGRRLGVRPEGCHPWRG